MFREFQLCSLYLSVSLSLLICFYFIKHFNASKNYVRFNASVNAFQYGAWFKRNIIFAVKCL